jgi:hypothetical protein
MEGATTWGNRFIQITLNWFGTNEFLQPVLVQVRPSSASGVPSALLLTNGYNAFPRVDLFDGPAGTSTAPPAESQHDPLPGVAGLSNQLAFIMLVFDVNGTYDVVECGLASNIYGTPNLAVTRFCATSNPAAGAFTCAPHHLVPACINWRIGPLANARGSERNSGP